MATFNDAVNYVLDNEKGLEENPHDPGGITKFGISLRFLRSLPDVKKYGIYTDQVDENDVKMLSIGQAKLIYLHEFWNQSRFDEIKSQAIATYLFDASVNMGISPAIKCLQRAIWSVTKDRSLLDDGILGNETLNKLNELMDKEKEILSSLRSERAGDYRAIASHNPVQSLFLNGWLNRSYEVNKDV